MLRRILASAALLALAAALLVVAWPELFRLQRTAIIAQLVSFRGAIAMAALVIVVLLLLLVLVNGSFRRFGSALALLVLAFGLVNVAVLATRGVGNPAFTTKSSSDITVLSWNTLGDAPGAKAIASLALDAGADVVVLPETTRATADAVAGLMQAGGHPMTLHSIAFDQVSKARSTSMLISARLGDYRVDGSAGSTSTLPTIVAQPADGSGPTIVAVHAVSPVPGELPHWRSDLEWLSKHCTGNTIMAGDFNATLDHMVGLATPGKSFGNCTDAASSTRNAGIGTWPTALPALLGAPIDHVMVTDGWRVTGMRVIEDQDKAGSDHRPVVAQLQHAG
ncbi:endonuclease/exonuclease/phosphatase family protein [Parafrigoribacterium soli]|uniref:endonuclease/exonuclease/phosphatase family protein n=1 Tax=Parafrigoribacterium soli TaxID=3144663 RepID=UPI0032ECD123